MRSDIIAAAVIILALVWGSYVIIAAASQPRIIEEPPCRTQWGVPKECDYE